MYRVKLYHLRRNVKFVVMNSVYYTDKSLQTFYDLKGSEIGREAKPGQDVLKDNDLRKKLPEGAIALPEKVRENLRAQIVSDCHFLRKMQIMDYSMLIGINHIPPKEEAHKHGNIAETGFRIKERQLSNRVQHLRQGSHGNDPMQAAAAAATLADESKHAEQQEPSESETRESLMNEVKGDSTRKLISDIRDSTYQVSNFEFAGLLDEEDDCSYLEGSDEYKSHKSLSLRHQHRPDEEVEFKKEQTIEQIYWPFHRFYDINGLRRMKPKPCFRCNTNPCVCHSDLLKKWRIPDFVPPLSTRKDGGLAMDTTGLNLPLTFHGPKGELQYEGKIFFMGIIDILQQYTSRKHVETRYRKIQHSKDKLEPSCVSPEEYADRFVRFFDEYSTRDPAPKPDLKAKRATGKQKKGKNKRLEKEETTGARESDVFAGAAPPMKDPRAGRGTPVKRTTPTGRVVVI